MNPPTDADITRLAHMDATHVSYDKQMVLVPHMWIARHGSFDIDWPSFRRSGEHAVTFEDGTCLADLLGIKMVQDLTAR
tara:strand:- start:4760 stop:4996 length:237 start_codon:yes stop_codon:yes gene_type:complete